MKIKEYEADIDSDCHAELLQLREKLTNLKQKVKTHPMKMQMRKIQVCKSAKMI